MNITDFNIQFNEYELNTFDTLYNDSTRYKLMAFYRVMILNSKNGVVELGLRKLFNKYNTRNRKAKNAAISLGSVNNRIDKLLELGLIQSFKIGMQKQGYKLTRAQHNKIELDGKLDGKLDGLDSIESLQTSTSTEKIECPKSIVNNNIFNIYISESEADIISNDLIKTYKIKRPIVIAALKDRLKQVYSKINVNGARAYISKMIINTVEYFRAASKKANSIINLNKNKKCKSNNNYNVSKSKNMKFNNHTEREYTTLEHEEMYDNNNWN